MGLGLEAVVFKRKWRNARINQNHQNVHLFITYQMDILLYYQIKGLSTISKKSKSVLGAILFEHLRYLLKGALLEFFKTIYI